MSRRNSSYYFRPKNSENLHGWLLGKINGVNSNGMIQKVVFHCVISYPLSKRTNTFPALNNSESLTNEIKKK